MNTFRQIEEIIIGKKLDEPNLPLDNIIKIVENSTILDTFQRHIEPNWTKRFFTDNYHKIVLNEYYLKTFLICTYPLTIIEAILKDEYREEFRNIKGLILYSDSEINSKKFEANARQISRSENLIVFNEQFFNFLFDYYLIEPTLINKFGIDNSNLDKKISLSQNDFYSNYTNNYEKFNLNKFLTYPENAYGNEYKFKFFSALMFIFSHEIGHCYLGHTNRHIWDLEFSKINERPNSKEVPFNKTQIDELDADMFASDICMNFIHNFCNQIDDEFRIKLMREYFSTLWHFAKSEEKYKKELNTNTNAEHPPSKYRIIYLLLRNKKYYEKLNMTLELELIQSIEQVKNDIVFYDFTKNLGADKILKY